MKITRVRAHPISTKLDKVYWTSRGAWGSYNMILVEVETDEGIVGYGQINKTPLGEIAAIVVELEEVIRGMDALAHEAVWSRLLDLTVPHLAGGRSEAIRPRYTEGKRIQIMAALGGIDIALWDIKGKAAGLPLWRLLGGDRREVPAYASGGYYEEGYSPLAVIDEMASYVAEGYSAVKMKCGGLDLSGDLERVGGVRKAIGDASLMLDANGAYNLRDAERAIKNFEPYDIFWFEEPLHWYDATRGLARLAACTDVPLASGESELHSWAVRDLIDLGGIRYVQFDCTRAGGITEGLRIGAYALAHGLQIALHHDPQVHGHLVAAMPHGYCVEGFPRPARDPVWHHLYSERPELEKGVLRLTDKPGLGVEIDWKVVEKWRI
jgi:L-alanine-DL-glutamate epimerase-like enolase superfamily enzyme